MFSAAAAYQELAGEISGQHALDDFLATADFCKGMPADEVKALHMQSLFQMLDATHREYPFIHNPDDELVLDFMWPYAVNYVHMNPGYRGEITAQTGKHVARAAFKDSILQAFHQNISAPEAHISAGIYYAKADPESSGAKIILQMAAEDRTEDLLETITQRAIVDDALFGGAEFVVNSAITRISTQNETGEISLSNAIRTPEFAKATKRAAALSIDDLRRASHGHGLLVAASELPSSVAAGALAIPKRLVDRDTYSSIAEGCRAITIEPLMQWAPRILTEASLAAAYAHRHISEQSGALADAVWVGEEDEW